MKNNFHECDMRESKTEADFILKFHGKSTEIFLSSRLNFVVQAALLSKLWQRSKIEERHENQKLLKHICFDCMLRSSYAEALTFIFIPFESFSNELFMAATEHSFTSRSHKKWICWNVLLQNVVLFQHFAIHLLTERGKNYALKETRWSFADILHKRQFLNLKCCA